MLALSREVALAIHAVFEILAFVVAFRLYKSQRSRESSLSLKVGLILGAAIGSKVVGLLQDPSIWSEAPAWRVVLTAGKSMVGGLLGGILGVEMAKKASGITESTGDAFFVPVGVGLIIGRIGCFLAGRWDNTAGSPTELMFGLDFGDGVARHPTQLYEMVFCAASLTFLPRFVRLSRASGMTFRAFALSYFVFRLAVDGLKDYPSVALGLKATQLAALCGILYYAGEAIWRWRTTPNFARTSRSYS